MFSKGLEDAPAAATLSGVTHVVCLHVHPQVFDGPGPETINSRLAMVSCLGEDFGQVLVLF